MGMKTFSSKWPCSPPTVIAWSFPITCAATCVTTSGMTGFTFRHDRAPLLELGKEDLGQPRAGARAHQSEVVGDLRQRDGDDLERA